MNVMYAIKWQPIIFMYGAREAGSITSKLKDGVVGETLVSLLTLVSL